MELKDACFTVISTIKLEELGIHSMELKGGRVFTGLQATVTARIHSMELKGLFCSPLLPKPLFSPFESIQWNWKYPKVVGHGLYTAPESIQWNWKRGKGNTSPSPSPPAESIQWNWKATGFHQSLRGEGRIHSMELKVPQLAFQPPQAPYTNPFNGIERPPARPSLTPY